MRHSTYLEVNLNYLQDNIDKIKLLTSSKILPMVKADAYGNGLVPISRFLVEECEIKRLGCASLGEAIHVLNTCPDLNAEMMVFSDTELYDPEVFQAYNHFGILPVLHQRSDLETVLNNIVFKKTPIVLKVNTGMNRLGLSLEEIAEFAPLLKNRGVKHLMTHFACSYYPLKDGDKTHRQMDNFIKAKQILIDAGVEIQETSVANSGAIEQKFGTSETYVRPGLMMYGPPSLEPHIWNGHQISKFVTRILKTFIVKKGTPVGYGINVVSEDSLIAIIPVGYADWSITTASGTELKVNGMNAKIFARVNMDMSFLIFEASASGKVNVGDQVEIWNHDNSRIADLASQMKTIPYHLMCGVTNRIPRIYKVK